MLTFKLSYVVVMIRYFYHANDFATESVATRVYNCTPSTRPLSCSYQNMVSIINLHFYPSMSPGITPALRFSGIPAWTANYVPCDKSFKFYSTFPV
jgi:hypothetical protein